MEEKSGGTVQMSFLKENVNVSVPDRPDRKKKKVKYRKQNARRQKEILKLLYYR